MISYTIDAARQSRLLDRVVCSTDSERIFKLVRARGLEAIKRPSRYATDYSPIEEPLRHAVEYLKEKDGYRPDAIALLYANVPFREKGLIDSAIKKMISCRADALVTVSPVERFHPERLVILAKNRRFNLYAKKISTFRSQRLPPVFYIDSGLIILKTSLLYGSDPFIVSHYFKGHKVIGFTTGDLAAWDIDNYFDLEIAGLIMKKRKGGMII